MDLRTAGSIDFKAFGSEKVAMQTKTNSDRKKRLRKELRERRRFGFSCSPIIAFSYT